MAAQRASIKGNGERITPLPAKTTFRIFRTVEIATKSFRVGSCGKEAPNYEIKVANPETDEEVSRGNIGEVIVRPRIPSVMLHYYHKMPEKTVEDFRNF